ncbi:MAG: tRNA lysidine(34) synthetase TilS [Notoacmeibacter sp.]|nr:tRNA lysidine(34) synthetase TilS [Notoacmeibacter sp.]MCC0031570.1 tRNA lysidine(34) synthetase TilS [Brucellaceae bacterium]
MQALAHLTFPDTGQIAVAVSGGGDSMALLAMLSVRPDLITAQRLLAVTVDHGLRPESAGEAERVKRWCDVAGIAHVTQRWMHPATGHGVQAAARAARYALLGDAAAQAGAVAVLTAHTLDDQRETVAMRARRGPGRGLAGIAPATRHMASGLWFCRPFLGVSRASLRDWLRGTGTGWIDDPSNDNASFERIRLRRALRAADGNHLARLDAEVAAASRARVCESEAVAQWLAQHARPAGQRRFTLDRSACGRDGEVAVAALRLLLAHGGRRDQLPAREAVLSRMEMLGGNGDGRFTLSGCLVTARGGTASIMPEPSRRGQVRQSVGVMVPGLHPWASLLPLHDLAAAASLARLAGLEDPAAPRLGGL